MRSPVIFTVLLAGCPSDILIGADAGFPDAGAFDAGFPDAGTRDDAGFPDAGTFDAGSQPDAGNCVFPPVSIADSPCEDDADVCDGVDTQGASGDVLDVYSRRSGDQFVVQVRFREHPFFTDRGYEQTVSVLIDASTTPDIEDLHNWRVTSGRRDREGLSELYGQMVGLPVSVRGGWPLTVDIQGFQGSHGLFAPLEVRIGTEPVVEFRFARDLVETSRGIRYAVAASQEAADVVVDGALPPHQWITSRGGQLDTPGVLVAIPDLTCPQPQEE